MMSNPGISLRGNFELLADSRADFGTMPKVPIHEESDMTRKPTFRVNKFTAGVAAIALAIGGVAGGVALSASAAVTNIEFVGNPGTAALNSSTPYVAVTFDGLNADEPFTAQFLIDELGGPADFVPVGTMFSGQADSTGAGVVAYPTDAVTVAHGDTIRVVVTPDVSGAAEQEDYVVFADDRAPRRASGFSSFPISTADLFAGTVEFIATNLPLSTPGTINVTAFTGSTEVYSSSLPFSTDATGRVFATIAAFKDGGASPLTEGDTLSVQWVPDVPGIGIFSSPNTTWLVSNESNPLAFVIDSSTLGGGVPNYPGRPAVAVFGNTEVDGVLATGTNINIMDLEPGVPADFTVSVVDSEGVSYPDYNYSDTVTADARGVITLTNVSIYRSPGVPLGVGDRLDIFVNGDRVSNFHLNVADSAGFRSEVLSGDYNGTLFSSPGDIVFADGTSSLTARDGANFTISNLPANTPVTVELSLVDSFGDPFPTFSFQNGGVTDGGGSISFTNVPIYRSLTQTLQAYDILNVSVELDGEAPVAIQGVEVLDEDDAQEIGGIFHPNAFAGSETFGVLSQENPLPVSLFSGLDFEFFNLNSDVDFGYQIVTSENTPVSLDDVGAYTIETADSVGRSVINFQASLGGEELVPGNYYGIIYYDLVNGTEHLLGSWQVEEDITPAPEIEGTFVGIAGTEPTADEFLAGVAYRVTGLAPTTGYRLQAAGSMTDNIQPDFDTAQAFTSDADGEHLTSVSLGLGLVTPTDPLEPGTYWAVYLFDADGTSTLLSSGRIPGGEDPGNGGGGETPTEPIASFVNGNPTGEELVDGVDVLVQGLDPAESYTVEFFGTLPDTDERILLSTTNIDVGDVSVDGEYTLSIEAYLDEGGNRVALPDGTLLELVLTDELDVQLTVLAYTLGDVTETPIAGGDGDGELAATGSDDISVQNALFALIGGSFLLASALGVVVFLRRKKSLEPIRVQE